MRVLNGSQKRLLRNAYARYAPSKVEDLASDDWQTLEGLGDFETLYQETNRYLNDLNFSGENNASFGIAKRGF